MDFYFYFINEIFHSNNISIEKSYRQNRPSQNHNYLIDLLLDIVELIGSLISFIYIKTQMSLLKQQLLQKTALDLKINSLINKIFSVTIYIIVIESL